MARGYNTATQYSCKLGPYMMEIGYCPAADITSNCGSADVSETHCIPTRLTHVIAGWLYSQCEAGDGYVGCITGSGSINDCTGTGGATDTPDTTAIPIVCYSIDTSCSGAGGDHYIQIGW